MHDMMFIHCMLVNSDVCGYLVWQVPPCTVQNLLFAGNASPRAQAQRFPGRSCRICHPEPQGIGLGSVCFRTSGYTLEGFPSGIQGLATVGMS